MIFTQSDNNAMTIIVTNTEIYTIVAIGIPASSETNRTWLRFSHGAILVPLLYNRKFYTLFLTFCSHFVS